MSDIKTWTNAAASQPHFSEGMLPSQVNDDARQVMAAVRRWYEDAEWIDLGYTPTYASAASFTLAGDRTSIFHPGRRLKLADNSTIYAEVVSASYSATTGITVALESSGSLTVSLSGVSVGILSFNNPSIPSLNGIYTSQFPDISIALSAAQITGKTLFLNSIVSLSSALTISSTVSLAPLANGKFVKATGGSLTINGPVVGNPMHQWLSGFAAGEVTIIGEVKAVWFGLSGSGTAATNTTAMDVALGSSNDVTVTKGSANYACNTFGVGAGKLLRIEKGAIFAPVSGQIIKVSGILISGPYQIVSSTNVTESGSPLRFIHNTNIITLLSAYPEWWGAIADGKNGNWGDFAGGQTDNYIPLQQAFLACVNMPSSPTKSSSAPRLSFNSGRYDYGTPIVVDSSTQSLYGFLFEGAVGGKGSFTSPSTSALMQTGLHYIGTGTGITIGNASYHALGGVIRNIWFSALQTSTCAVQAYMSDSVIEECMFTSTGNSGVEGGLRITGYSDSISRCSFNDCWDGLWLDGVTATTIDDCIFIVNRGTFAAIVAGSLSITFIGNTFQDNITDAIGVYMGGGYAAAQSNGVSIINNYFEATTGHSNRIILNGTPNPSTIADYVINVTIRDNYFSSVGSLANEFINLYSCDGTKIGPNSNLRGQAKVGIRATSGNNKPTNTLIASEDYINVIPEASGTVTATNDLNECSWIFTNGNATGTITYVLQAAYTGMKYRFVKTVNQTFTIDGSGSETINGAATISNSSAEAGAATIEIQCITAGAWVVVSKTGTWA